MSAMGCFFIEIATMVQSQVPPVPAGVTRPLFQSHWQREGKREKEKIGKKTWWKTAFKTPL